MSSAPDLHVVSSAERFPSQELWLMSQVTVLSERVGGVLEAMVPVELINREDVPVDVDHVNELAESIKKEALIAGEGTGQLSPILIAEVPDQDKFMIIDGFHRDAALQTAGRQTIFSTIRRGTTLEEVLDLRILTATTHTSVSFARVTEWINDAWSRSEWVDKITVVQAFALTKTDSSGRNLGLTADDVRGINEWVNDKCEKWRMSPATVHINLTTAELADPELVKEARRRVGGHELTDITPQHLGVIAKAFPRQYAMQRLASSIAKANNMNIPTARAMTVILQQASTFEEAVELAEQTQWEKVKPVYAATRAREVARKEEQLRAELATQWTEHEGSLSEKILVMDAMLGRVSLEALVYKGRYVSPIYAPSDVLGFEVTTAPADMQKAIAPHVQEQVIDDFVTLTDELAPSLSRTLIAKHGLNETDAHNIIRAAAFNVTQDMETGDLRFVELGRKATMQELLTHGIGSYLEKRVRPVPAIPEQAKQQPNIEQIAFYDLAKAVQRMDDMRRRAFVLRGILGLSTKITAAIVGKKETAIPYYLLDAQQVIADRKAGISSRL